MPDLDQTLLGLFTEIAIVEHLVRTRIESNYPGELSPNEFGILNYFVSSHPGPDTVAGIAWSFQQDEDYTAANITALAGRGFLTLTPAAAARDVSVNITESGREALELYLAKIGPDFRQLVSEIPREELETARRALHEIRLVLDNLPDR